MASLLFMIVMLLATIASASEISLNTGYKMNGKFSQIKPKKTESIVHETKDGKPRPKKFIPERDQQWFDTGVVATLVEH